MRDDCDDLDQQADLEKTRLRSQEQSCAAMGGTLDPNNLAMCYLGLYSEREPGEDTGLYFDLETKIWRDEYGKCHTCTPRYGFNANGTFDCLR